MAAGLPACRRPAARRRHHRRGGEPLWLRCPRRGRCISSARRGGAAARWEWLDRWRQNDPRPIHPLSTTGAASSGGAGWGGGTCPWKHSAACRARRPGSRQSHNTNCVQVAIVKCTSTSNGESLVISHQVIQSRSKKWHTDEQPTRRGTPVPAAPAHKEKKTAPETPLAAHTPHPPAHQHPHTSPPTHPPSRPPNKRGTTTPPHRFSGAAGGGGVALPAAAPEAAAAPAVAAAETVGRAAAALAGAVAPPPPRPEAGATAAAVTGEGPLAPSAGAAAAPGPGDPRQ